LILLVETKWTPQQVRGDSVVEFIGFTQSL